jgi:hypothetical protein
MVRIFRLMLVLFYIYIYIYSTNVPPIMFINRIYETQNLLVAVAFFLPARAKNLSATPVDDKNTVFLCTKFANRRTENKS